MASPIRKQPRRLARDKVKPIILTDFAESDSEGSEHESAQNQQDDFLDSLAAELPQDEEGQQSDYEAGRSKRKRKSTTSETLTPQWLKKTKRARESPEISDLSDLSSDDEHEEDLRLFERRKRVIPPVKSRLTSTTLQLDVRSPTIINIDLGGLIRKITRTSRSLTTPTELDGSTLVDIKEAEYLADRCVSTLTEPTIRLDPRYACFLDLEPGLRNRIYRAMLVESTVVKISPFSASTREPAILRTCHQIHNEGSGILYGENAFHFERADKVRTRYGDNEGREVGYKDVRRFLETVGQHNVAKLRFVSIQLSDAVPSFTSKLEAAERRFVNDAVLHRVLKLIGGSGCKLDKFVVGFVGRSEVTRDDVMFLRAFTSISVQGKVMKTCKFGHAKIHGWLWGQLKEFMTVSKPTNFDPDRQKAPKMQHDLIDRSWCHRRFSYSAASCSD